MSFIVTTFIILHLKEVLINNNTNDAHKNCRNGNKTAEEEECHIFGIVAFAVTDEEGNDCEEEDYEVVHDFVFCVSCYS